MASAHLAVADARRGRAAGVAQMLGYLNITGLRVALLLNFKHAKLQWRRVLL